MRINKRKSKAQRLTINVYHHYPTQKKSYLGKLGTALIILVAVICGTMVMTEPVTSARAADGKQSETLVISDDNITVNFDANGDVIGWSRNEEALPVQLPKRNITVDEQGMTVIQIEDPDSLIFDQKLMEIEQMPHLRPVDTAAIKLATAYDEAKSAPHPYMQNNGRINFYFGTMNPRLQCRPLRLTDIELEPGEQISKIHVSDTARWSVSLATSGTLDYLVTHVIVKPMLPDIAANLLIHTDRRTYSIELLSVTQDQYMPYVGFIYPEITPEARAEDEASWNNLLRQYGLANGVKSAKDRAANMSGTDNARLTDAAKIYTGYTMKVTAGGKKQKELVWFPTDVYDANGKTYVVMPEKVKLADVPAFFVKHNGRETLANYRLDQNKIIVDRIFDIGILQLGKDRVAIYRDKPIGQD